MCYSNILLRTMKLKYTFKSVKLDNSIIICINSSIDRKLYSVLKANESALEILDILKDVVTEFTIIQLLQKRYTISYENLQKTICMFIQKLDKAGLLEYIPSSNMKLQDDFVNNIYYSKKNSLEAKRNRLLFVEPKIEIVKYTRKENTDPTIGKHSHCKSPSGHEHSHE